MPSTADVYHRAVKTTEKEETSLCTTNSESRIATATYRMAADHAGYSLYLHVISIGSDTQTRTLTTLHLQQ